MPPRDIIFEYVQVGNSVRVSAVDAATGFEVTIQVPLSTSQADMRRVAISKLEYMMRKQQK